MSAGDLAQALGIAPPAMSRRLKAMKKAGLVTDSHPEFDARIRIYALNAARLREIRVWLERAEDGWSRQLARLKVHVEAQKRSEAE
jgi:DNA-binding transcriptional ArsR family regulator